MIDPCDICGDIGFEEFIATCVQCKIAREHGYCMQDVLLTIPELWICEECQLSKAIVPDSIVVEDVSMSSTSINSGSVCTSPILKPSSQLVDHENEMVSKSNISKTLNSARLLKNQKRLGSPCKVGASRVRNLMKSSAPSTSEHLVRNLVLSLDESNAMATASKSSPAGSKVASTKPSLKKFKPSHVHKKIRHFNSKFSSTSPPKANQKSKFLKDEETSATCEKEKHDTSMLGEKSETSQSQQRNSEEVAPEGLDSLPVNTIASILTELGLDKIAMKYHIDRNRYHLSLPKSSDRANSYFPCKQTFCIYAEAFKAGLRLPLHPLIPEILNEFGVAPTQITPNSWRMLICFISFCYSQKITPSVNLFRAIFSLNSCSGEMYSGWFFFCPRKLKLFEGIPSSVKGWRNKFFIIRTSEGDALGVNMKWGSPKSEVNQLPTLTATEIKALDHLKASAANNLPNISGLLSEEALIQAGISSTLPKSKGSKSEMKQRHSLSQSGLVRALQRKRAATELGKSALSGLRCPEPILIDIGEEDLPERKRPKESLQPMEQTDLLQQTELMNQPQEIAPHEVIPQQASPESNVQQNGGALVPTGSSIHFNTAAEELPHSNAKVMRTRSVEYTREQSVFTHPALAKQLIGEMVLPHDWDSVAQKDTFAVAHELRCKAMEDATWKMGVSEKLIKMQHEINTLKEERNALRESQKREAAELESARKTSVELQRLEEFELLENRLKDIEKEFANLKRRLKQAQNRAASAKRKFVVAEKRCRQAEMEKLRIAEETLKNYKASQEFLLEVEEYHVEAFDKGLNAAINKIKRQYPDLELSRIDFLAEED